MFSESRFLNKTPSTRNADEDLEVDSDYSDDHSVHSLKERARRQKNRGIKPSQQSSNQVVMDQASRSGSPVSSSRSIREQSPPWNIEETIPSSPSSAKPASNPPDNGHSAPVQKDITVSTERSAWASKLRNPGPHKPEMPDNTISASGSHLPQAPPAQHQTVSAYFAPIVTQRESQLSAAPSIELDRPEDRLLDQVDSGSIATPDSADPPSTPECLQLEHARFLSAPGDTYVQALDGSSSNRIPTSPATNLQADDVQPTWNYEMEPQPERGVKSHFTVGRTKRMGWANEHIWNDSDIPGWEEYPHSCNSFLVEAQFHDVHSNVDYDALVEDRVTYSNGEAEYLYEESECAYEDGEYLDRNIGAYTLHQEDDDFEYGDYEEETPLERLNDRNPHMEVEQEQELYQSIEWPTIDDTIEDLDPDQAYPELDEIMVQDESMVTDDEWAEQTPRLIRVITEASLQDDLIKSMSGHWSVAHRLY